MGLKKSRCDFPNQAIGISRGGRTTKIHALADGLGNPIKFILTGGQVHDAKAAIEVLAGIDLTDVNVIADKGYVTKEIMEYIIACEGSFTIPPKANP